jgi:hypothetical protein
MRNGRLFQNGGEIHSTGLAAALNSAAIRFLSTFNKGDRAGCRSIIAPASADVGPPPGHDGLEVGLEQERALFHAAA